MEFLEDIWTGITRNFTKSKEQEDFDCVMMAVHVIAGIICTIIVACFTPLGLYAIGTFIATVILAIFWMSADIKDNLAAGFFFSCIIIKFRMGSLSSNCNNRLYFWFPNFLFES